MGMFDANSDRDYYDAARGPYAETEEKRHTCKRCGALFTKPDDYPEWTTRVCDPCRTDIQATQERKMDRGAA
jgi:formylmethanofuran dehydrogenase subunit E